MILSVADRQIGSNAQNCVAMQYLIDSKLCHV
jgi:hypothetical protein